MKLTVETQTRKRKSWWWEALKVPLPKNTAVARTKPWRSEGTSILIIQSSRLTVCLVLENKIWWAGFWTWRSLLFEKNLRMKDGVNVCVCLCVFWVCVCVQCTCARWGECALSEMYGISEYKQMDGGQRGPLGAGELGCHQCSDSYPAFPDLHPPHSARSNTRTHTDTHIYTLAAWRKRNLTAFGLMKAYINCNYLTSISFLQCRMIQDVYSFLISTLIFTKGGNERIDRFTDMRKH